MGGPGNRIIEKARRLALTTSLTICSTRYSFTSPPLYSTLGKISYFLADLAIYLDLFPILQHWKTFTQF
jgi:hypothetical protein